MVVQIFKQMTIFERQEVMSLAGITSSRLAYLERINLIVPSRLKSNGSRSEPLFTFEQIVAIRAIRDFKISELPRPSIQKFIEFLSTDESQSLLRSTTNRENLESQLLIMLDDQVFWIKEDWSNFAEKLPPCFKSSGRKNDQILWYTMIVIPSLVNIVDDIWKEAIKSNSVKDIREKLG